MSVAQIAAMVKDPSSLASAFGFVPNLINDIIIDVLNSESPNYEYEITRHPIEGLDITDNRTESFIGLSLDCTFTDMQLSATNVITSSLNGNFSLSTWRDKMTALYTLMESNQTIQIRTPNGLYDSMMIRSISPYDDNDCEDSFSFNIELEKIKTVASLSGYIDPDDLPIESQDKAKPDKKTTKSKTSAGNQTAQTDPEIESSTESSFAGSLIGSDTFNSGNSGFVL